MTTQYPVLVQGKGPKPARGMIIGEAPGETERNAGWPFLGESGTRLDAALAKADASRDEIFITNLFKGDVGSKNRNPRQDEIRDHRPLLVQEFIEVQPRSVLLLGAVPTRDFFPRCKPLGPWVGTGISVAGIRWFPCWHPANRDPTTRPEFEAAVKSFVRSL